MSSRWRLHDLSLRRKLTLMIVLTSCVAVLLAGLVIVVRDQLGARRTLVRDLSVMADVIGDNAAAALAFRDPEAAVDVLSALAADARVRAACVYDVEGRPFATFRGPGPGRAPALPARSGALGHDWGEDSLSVSRAVRLDAETLGTILILVDLRTLGARLRENAAVLAATLAGSALVTFLLAVGVQRIVSGPVLELTRASQQVSVAGDTSLRVVKRGQDEIGILVDAFNEMLEQLQQRDLELEGYRSHLEDQVAERTVQLRRLNAQLKASMREANAATRAKSELLAHVSHEVRTPMNGVIGTTELLLRSELSAEQRELVHTLQASAEHLLAIIADILDFSKIEAGKLTLEARGFDLRELVRESVDVVAPLARRKGLVLASEVDPRLPRRLIGDAGRLRQVLLNLLGNAVKFTDDGDVELRVEPAPEGLAAAGEAGGVALRASVRDTGPGIPPDRLQCLFEAFSQVGPASARRAGGTGLGLSISKQLVERMGGSIGVESEPGVGSTFWFALELAEDTRGADEVPRPARAAAAAEERGPRAGEQRVLVVEDDPVGRAVASRMLAHLGYEHDVAADGLEALERVAARSYALVLIDCQMPELDGFAATRILREASAGTSLQLPVVAMTANAMDGDRERCIAVGMDDYLSKPAKLDELRAVLERWIPRARPLWAAPAAGAPDHERLLALLRETADDVRALEAACAADDAEALAAAARRLREAAAALPAEPLRWSLAVLGAAGREVGARSCERLVTAARHRLEELGRAAQDAPRA